jgi:hypothetical protein
LLIITERGVNPRLFERFPSPDGTRVWQQVAVQEIDNPSVLSEYQDRRIRQDPDLWIVELDIANGERLIGLDEPRD